MKRIIFLILIIGTSFSVFASTNDNLELFEKANKLYSEKKYENAIEIYKKIENSGFHSTELYYNLGNSYYRAGNITNAILYYEKAKLISPADDDIDHNLSLAKELVYNKIVPMPEFAPVRWYKQFIGLASADTHAFYSVLSFILLLSAIFIYLFSANKRIKTISFFASAFLLMFSVSTFIFAQSSYKQLNSKTSAIVTGPVVSVKSSPDANSTELFSVHEGLKVKITDNSDRWYEVVFEDGRVGWLKKDELALI